MPNQILLDSGESAFFQKELEYVKRKSYDTKYKNLKATMLIPVSTDGDPGAAQIAYTRYTSVGIAKIISHYADDIPAVDVYGEKVNANVYRISDKYGYDRDEIRNSKLANKRLEQRRANAAKRASDEKVNSIALKGDTDNNIPSFIDYPGITEYTIPVGASTFKAWSTKTPDEIIADMSGIVTAVIALTNGVEVPDTMLMPIEQFELIANKRMTDGDSMTVLQFFLKNNPHIKTIDWLTELKGAGAGGTDRILVYPRDPDHLELEIPLPYQQLPPQQIGLGFEIITETKTAGVVVYYPLSMAYGDGI